MAKPADTDASPQKVQDAVKLWCNKVTDARKREKDYRREGQKCVRLYEATSNSNIIEPFAILYANTDTLAPAIYNTTPIPIVDRRFKDPDPIAKCAAETGTRVLKFLIEAEDDDNDTFDALMTDAVLNTLLTNRGVTRFKYDAELRAATEQLPETVEAECVYGEGIRWDKFTHGYARTWKKVPWVCFEWDMTEAEFKENFPDAKVDFSRLEAAPPSETENGGRKDQQETYNVKLAPVYEIWDKRTRKVYFVSPVYQNGFLKEPIDDPLGLSGFFPCPKPMNFMPKVSTLTPTPLYTQYESQARELNDLTVRLKHLIQACKIRGFYNSTIEGIEKVLESEENVLTPVENMASMPEGMGVDKLIWLMPVQEIASTIQVLYMQREQCKQVIYEITGISDILRGATQASETATAQSIKNEWGTLRLKKLQKEVQRYCRDSLRIMLEIAVTKFSQKTVVAMTGLPYPTAQQKAEAAGIVQQVQAMSQMAQQSGGQIPMPPPPPPQLMEAAAAPSWEEILGLLRNDISRAYRVDIETNSTVNAEATQDKADIAELLNAISQFLNGVAPLIESGVMPFEVAQGILLAITRRFTFGPQLEDAIQKMKQPEPQADPAAQAKAEESKMKLEFEKTKQAGEMQKMQLEAEMAKQQAAIEQQKLEMEAKLMVLEMQIKEKELLLQQQELTMKAEFAVESHKLKLQQAKETAAMKTQQAKAQSREKESA